MYWPTFLNRWPKCVEQYKIAEDYAAVGFPGCIGAVDCMEIHWKNCPSAKNSQFHNRKEGKLATVSLETWDDHGLYVWSWFGGHPGTNNDVTLLSVSPLFNDIQTGTFNIHLQTS